MKFTVRPYLSSDWPLIKSWWDSSGEIAPLPDMMPLDSSFICECDDRPMLAVTIYLTNSFEIAYVENFIGDPKLKGGPRKEGARVLSDHIAAFARAAGYKRLLCMSEKSPLVNRYRELGFIPTLSGVTTLVRSL